MGPFPNISAAAAALFLCAGCAKQLPPPGGPPDSTPPRVLWTRPSADTTGVPLDARIQVRFTERMDRRSVERSVFVSPRPAEPTELRVRGDRLEVRVPGGLRPERTYVITLGTDCADESRNRMASSYSFAFATGRELNRGHISGTVYPAAERGVQPYVWAYDLGVDEAPDPAHAEPAYITQPGADGRYDFPRLGPGRYRVFAVGDRNRDRLYTPGEDLLAVPPADVVIAEGGEAVGLGALRMARRDTTGPRLTGVRTPDAAHMVLRFDEPVGLPEGVSVTWERGALEVRAVYHDPEDSSRVWLVTGRQDPAVRYSVSADGFTDRSGNRAPEQAPIRVRGEASPDGRGPSVVRLEPADGAGGVAPSAVLRMVFDEALGAGLPADLWVATDSSSAPAGRFDRTAPNVLVFKPEDPWAEGSAHLLIGRPGALEDAAGHPCEGRLVFRFSVRAEDTLGDLEGRLFPAAGRVRLTVAGMASGGDARTIRLSEGDSVYTVKALPPGDYHVWGFADVDDDGTWFPGKAVPYAPAEPVALSADTVEVRARWVAESGRRLRFDRVYPLPASEEE